MATTEAPARGGNTSIDHRGWPTVGVVLGALGILAAVWAYWMIVPGIVFGIAAIALGVGARRRGIERGGQRRDRARYRCAGARSVGAVHGRRGGGPGTRLRPVPVESRLLTGATQATRRAVIDRSPGQGSG